MEQQQKVNLTSWSYTNIVKKWGTKSILKYAELYPYREYIKLFVYTIKTYTNSPLLYTSYASASSIQLLLKPHTVSLPFMPPRRLRIRGFPELTCLMLSESRCLPFDPEILSDRHSGTPICQNSVLFPHIAQTSASHPPPRPPTPRTEIRTGAVRTPDMFSGRKELKIRHTSWIGMRGRIVYVLQNATFYLLLICYKG